MDDPVSEFDVMPANEGRGINREARFQSKCLIENGGRTYNKDRK
jgi:hypothetical protein